MIKLNQAITKESLINDYEIYHKASQQAFKNQNYKRYHLLMRLMIEVEFILDYKFNYKIR